MLIRTSSLRIEVDDDGDTVYVPESNGAEASQVSEGIFTSYTLSPTASQSDKQLEMKAHE